MIFHRVCLQILKALKTKKLVWNTRFLTTRHLPGNIMSSKADSAFDDSIFYKGFASCWYTLWQNLEIMFGLSNFCQFLKKNSSPIFWKWCYPFSVRWIMTNIFSQIKFKSEFFFYTQNPSISTYIFLVTVCIRDEVAFFQSTKRPQFGLFVSLRIKDNDV